MKKTRAQKFFSFRKAISIEWSYSNGYVLIILYFKNKAKHFGPYWNGKRARQDYYYLAEKFLKRK